MAIVYYTLDNLATGDQLTETFVDEARLNLAGLIVPAACRAVRSSAQTINDASFTAVQFNATDTFDTDAMHDPSSNNTRVTFNTTGVYIVTADLAFNAVSDVQQAAQLRIDGSTVIASSDFGTGVNTTLAVVYAFTAGQYVELRVYQDNTASSTRTVTGSLAAAWIGRTTAP